MREKGIYGRTGIQGGRASMEEKGIYAGEADRHRRGASMEEKGIYEGKGHLWGEGIYGRDIFLVRGGDDDA
jgi:hypothetical protein